MARRDPNTGQYISGEDDGSAMEYATLDFQNIHVGAVSGLGDPEDGADERIYEPLDGDLGHDELAEVVGYERSLGLDVIELDTSQSQHGTAGAQCELGINTDGAERMTSDNRDPSWFSEDGPEYLDVSAQSTMFVGYNDAAAGISGAGGGFDVSEKQLWFTDHMDFGPFLDEADSISIRVEADSQNCLHHIEAQAFWKIYYRVWSIEGARRSFGRPT